MLQLDCFAMSVNNDDSDCNEDFTLVQPRAGIFVVADGMGGCPGGGEASRVAARSFCEALQALEPHLRVGRQNLAQAVNTANMNVRAVAQSNPMMTGLGTTLSAVVLQGTRGKIVHVGDSRVYLFRNGHLRQLTEDHTLVAALIERQRITAEEAKQYPLRNVLVRSIGTQETVEPDILDLTVQEGDWLILATDGLAEVLGVDDLSQVIEAEGAGSADKLCHAVITLAKQNDPQDSISLVVVQILRTNAVGWDMDGYEENKE